MVQFSQEYPDYTFDRHKGYGTPAHRAALAEHGPQEIEVLGREELAGFLASQREDASHLLLVRAQILRARRGFSDECHDQPIVQRPRLDLHIEVRFCNGVGDSRRRVSLQTDAPDY